MRIQFIFCKIVLNAVGLTGKNRITIDVSQVTGRIDRLCRILIQICSGNTGFIAVVDIHSLRVQIEDQVIIQEGRIQVERSSNTLHLRAFNSTVVECVTHRSAVRHIHHFGFYATHERNVVVGRNSSTVDLVEPIYVVVHEVVVGLCRLTCSRCISAQFVACEDLEVLEHGTEADVTIVGHFQFLSGFTFLGCDEDDTVRCTATIDSGSGSVFEDGESLDIVRVNERERVRNTLNTIVIHGQTIDDDKRVIGSIQRRTSTDTDGCTTTRNTTVGCYVHTGDLTLDHVLCVGLETFVHVIRLDRGNRTGSIVFLNDTVTNDNDFVKELGVFAQLNRHSRFRIQLLRFITHIGDSQFRTGFHGKRKVTVKIGNRTVCGTHFQYRSTNNRFSV